MDNVTPLGGDVYEIDTRMAGYSGITAGYLILGDRPCLVETGTSTSAPVVRDALSSLGVGPDDLATVVVTHIHLDHAGGVGDIASFYPSAEIVVHEKGARHLADPSRLMASAKMVWGDKLDVLFGTLAPTDAARIRALGDTGTIALGNGRTLASHYSPATPNTTSACWTRSPATFTWATPPACICPRRETCGPPRRRRTSTSTSPSARSGCSRP
ncbi:hypothetical protein GCM10027612_59300 [Microbispora bryophytorum subsp. camponoti]